MIVVTRKSSWCSMAGMMQVLCVHCFSSFRSLSKYYPFNKAFLLPLKFQAHFSSVLFSPKLSIIILQIFQTISNYQWTDRSYIITYYVYIVSGRNRRFKFCEGRDFRDGCLFLLMFDHSVSGIVPGR